MELKGKLKTNFLPDIIACLLLVAMVLCFSQEMVWSRQVPFFRDLGTYFYPMRFNLAMSFQSGEIPLWNRHVAMGFPLAANFQSGAFYPPHLCFLLFSFFDAIRFLFVFHYFVAAMGSYFLCRQWQYPPYLALIGSILFTFGGMIVSLSNLMDHFQSAVWLPWALFSWERSLQSQSRGNFLRLIFVLVTQFLAGSPEIYGMSLGLLLLDGMRIKAKETNLTCAKVILLFLAANSLVAGLAMVQILPTVELFLQSSRSETMPYEKVTAWSLSPLSLINLFFLDKEVDLNAYNGWNFFFGQEPPLMISLYLGVLALPGLGLWLFASSLKEKTVVLGLAFLFLILAMGSYTPAYPFLFKYLTVFGLFRFPQKFLFPLYVLLLFVVLNGLFRFLHRQPLTASRPWLALMLIPLFLFLLYLFLRLEKETLIRFISWSKQVSVLHPATVESFSAVLFYLERQIVLILGLLVLLFLWKRRKLGSALFQFLFVSSVYFDLASAHRPYHFFIRSDLVYTAPQIVSTFPEPYRLFYLLHFSDLNPNVYAFTKKPFERIASSLFATLVPNTGVFHGFDYMQELEALRRKPYDMFLKFASGLPPERLYRLLGALNVKYINSFQSLPEGDITLVGHFPEHPAWLYRLDSVVPRVYIVSKVSQEKEPIKVLERLSHQQFNPLEEVLVDRALSIVAQEDFQARVALSSYKNDRVAIRASLNGSGVLVLADSYYPGWRVFVNGKEREILRANLFFRAVALSAGDHLVEFHYQPWSFMIGLIISLVTLCGVVIGSIVWSCSGRKQAVQQGQSLG